MFMSFFAPGSLPSNIGFGITGAFAAAYLVPLNAHLQDNCDPPTAALQSPPAT